MKLYTWIKPARLSKAAMTCLVTNDKVICDISGFQLSRVESETEQFRQTIFSSATEVWDDIAVGGRCSDRHYASWIQALATQEIHCLAARNMKAEQEGRCSQLCISLCASLCLR